MLERSRKAQKEIPRMLKTIEEENHQKEILFERFLLEPVGNNET